MKKEGKRDACLRCEKKRQREAEGVHACAAAVEVAGGSLGVYVHPKVHGAFLFSLYLERPGRRRGGRRKIFLLLRCKTADLGSYCRKGTKNRREEERNLAPVLSLQRSPVLADDVRRRVAHKCLSFSGKSITKTIACRREYLCIVWVCVPNCVYMAVYG